MRTGKDSPSRERAQRVRTSFSRSAERINRTLKRYVPNGRRTHVGSACKARRKRAGNGGKNRGNRAGSALEPRKIRRHGALDARHRNVRPARYHRGTAQRRCRHRRTGNGHGPASPAAPPSTGGEPQLGSARREEKTRNIISDDETKCGKWMKPILAKARSPQASRQCPWLT